MSFGAPSSGGKIHFASYAQAICLGPVHTLWRIKNGKTVIWTGPVFSTGANGNGATHLTTEIGTIRFYWGSSTQLPDSLLETLYVDGGASAGAADISPLKNVCYAVMEDVAFGQQTSPPTLKFELSRHTSNLTLNGKVGEVRVIGSAGYTSVPTVGFSGGGGTGAAATAYVNTDGEIEDIVITDPGAGYSSAPTVVLTGGGGSYTSATADLCHAITGNGVVPEMIYDLFTNTLYGLGIGTSSFITASFVSASDTVRDEGLGFNVVMEADNDARTWIGRMLNLIQAILYVEDGKVGIKLIRSESTSGIPTVDSIVLMEEPQPKNTLLADTWNMTVINWIDRRNLYEKVGEPFFDDANRAMQGEEVRRGFDFAFCNTEEVAQMVAARVGIDGGIPKLSTSLKILPSVDLRVGDLFWLDFPKTGFDNRLMRVTGRRHNDPASGGQTIEAIEEFTRDASTVYGAGRGNSGVGSAVDSDGKNISDQPVALVAPRIATIPTELKAGKADGLLAAWGMVDPLLTSAEVLFTWNPATKSYFLISDRVRKFPASGTVVWFERYRTVNWLFRIQFTTAAEAANMINLQAQAATLFLVVNGRTANPLTGSDTDTFGSLWLELVDGGTVTVIDGTTIELEVSAEAFGSTAIYLQGLATAGLYPSTACYVGPREAFGVCAFDNRKFERTGNNGVMDPQTGEWEDEDSIRYVKVKTWRGTKSANLDDCTEATYEHGAELTPSWGTFSETSAQRADMELGIFVDSNVETALYESVELLDDALGAVFNAHDNSAQELLAEHPDDVLGRLYFERDGIYSETR